MQIPTFVTSIFLSLLFRIHYTTANDLTLLNSGAPGDTLASSAIFLPDDLPREISDNHPTASGWTSDSGNVPESQQTNHESLLLAGNEIGNCADGAGYSDQNSLHSSSQRSLTRFNKRRDPDFCPFQQPEKPVPPQWSPGEAIPGNSKTGPLMGPGPNPEELRMLLYSIPGIDGPSNKRVCKPDSAPLYEIPVCAPKFQGTSPAAILNPCRFCKSEILKRLYPPPLSLLSTPYPHLLKGKKILFCCQPQIIFWG